MRLIYSVGRKLICTERPVSRPALVGDDEVVEPVEVEVVAVDAAPADGLVYTAGRLVRQDTRQVRRLLHGGPAAHHDELMKDANDRA